jgi:2-oxoisovalerate dehydrogenase E1 component
MNGSPIQKIEHIDIATGTPKFDWRETARIALTSRLLDEIEVNELTPKGHAKYQFSSGGHELGQAILSQMLNRPFDAASIYYRCRPFMLGSGWTPREALLNTMALKGSYSEGRDLPAVFGMNRRHRAVILPMAADIGSQFCIGMGWAQAIRYRVEVMGEKDKADSIAVVYGGDGAVASVGFWSALNPATTQNLPLLFVIENNGYAISTKSFRQTPGSNIAENLASFKQLRIWEADGTEPDDVSRATQQAVDYVRSGNGVGLLYLEMPRLCAHSGVDNQAYKSEEEKAEEWARDPLPKLKRYLAANNWMSEEAWDALENSTRKEIRAAYEAAQREPNPTDATRFAFYEQPHLQEVGGMWAELGKEAGMPILELRSTIPEQNTRRLTMVEAIRQTLDVELSTNPRCVMFGEDIGVKGNVHSVTLGLMKKHGEARVFDTSLNEEAILGRAVGMSLAGLVPVPEIQYRKYMDACYESLNNCGGLRWRSANHFAAPLVVRTSGGYRKVGDPWHSITSEVTFAHMTGWHVAVPSNAEDAVGLLRTAMRGNDPVIFFEHRFCYDSSWSRRPYPGDDFIVPMGKAKLIREGEHLTVVTWGAMVELCDKAAEELGQSIEVIDLRTLVPFDKETVLESVRKTSKVMIVHEDAEFGGFGAEISAMIADEAFFDLDAPIERVASPTIPVPFNTALLHEVVPTLDKIRETMIRMLNV